MTEEELRHIVAALIGVAPSNRGSPRTLMRLIHRRRFPGAFFHILEPMLHNDLMYKCAIDILGNLKEPPECVSEAIEAAWDRSWTHGVPQACDCAFPALLKLGGNDERLLSMIEKSLVVDNYGIHKLCAETLMQIEGGAKLLSNWSQTVRGQCQCHLHRKLAERISTFLSGR